MDCWCIGRSIQLSEKVEPKEQLQVIILTLLNPKLSKVLACISNTSSAVFPGTKFLQLSTLYQRRSFITSSKAYKSNGRYFAK